MTTDSSPVDLPPPLDLPPKELAAWLNEGVEGTLMEPMGIRAIEVGPQRAVAEFEVGSGVKTRTGYVHIKGSYVDRDRFPVAIGLTSQIVSNVQEGLVRAEAQVVHGGRTLIVVETRVTSGEGRLLALVNTTHFVRSGNA